MNISSYYALIAAGIMFAIVALFHLLRLIYKPTIIFGGKSVPLWVNMLGFILALLLSFWMFIASAKAQNLNLEENIMTLKLQSSAFKENSSIPSQYSCEGSNISPPLTWQGEPENTKSFVLIMDDPDAPRGTWDHWIIFNIPKTTHELAENLSALPSGAEHGKNSNGKSAYDGPCPPTGEHSYIFKLYALDNLLNLSAGASKSQVESAMQGHILADTKLIGRYQKIKK